MKKVVLFSFFFGFLSVGFFSCEPKNEAVVTTPPNILNETTFTKLLVDYALAESAANLNIKNVSLLRLDSTYAFAPLKENNISRSKYDSTLMFYSKHTVLYKKIYENVLAELSEIKTARDTLKMDSIHKKQISHTH
jgi:hypothetical protein